MNENTKEPFKDTERPLACFYTKEKASALHTRFDEMRIQLIIALQSDNLKVLPVPRCTNLIDWQQTSAHP